MGGSRPAHGPALRQRREDFEKQAKDAKEALRLESGDLSVRLDQQRVAQAADRVAAVETKPEQIELAGQFRGATLDTWRFDFRTDEGASISGRLADDVSEETAAAMNQFTNQQCLGKFDRILVNARGVRPKERYELLSISARPEMAQP